MKCFNHRSADAFAICRNCGKALCPDCILPNARAAIACSSDCTAVLAQDSKRLQLLLDKSAQSASASAFYCYLTAALSAGAAAAAWFMLPSPFLIYFTGACAVALAVSGFWHSRVARRQVL